MEMNITVEILMEILRNATRKSSNCFNHDAKHDIHTLYILYRVCRMSENGSNRDIAMSIFY